MNAGKNSYRLSIAFSILLSIGFGGCTARIKYDAGEPAPEFGQCMPECQSRMAKFDAPPLLCLLSNRERFQTYNRIMQRIDEVVAATRLPVGSCGCLLVEVSESGLYQNPEFRFSNSEAATGALTKAIQEYQFPEKVDQCLVGAKVPIVFGYSEYGSFRQIHTIHPMRQYVRENEFEEATEIPLSDSVGWSYLNGSFGIVYSGDARYLVEFECKRGLLDHSGFRLAGISASNKLEAGKSKINGCEIRTFYGIESDGRELDLKKIAVTPSFEYE